MEDDDVIAKHLAKAMSPGHCPTQDEVKYTVIIESPNGVKYTITHDFTLPADRIDEFINSLYNEALKIGETSDRGEGQDVNTLPEEA